MATTYIWKTKDGKELNIDEITDINHLRNIVKLLMRNNHKQQNERKKALKEKFTLNGDMANQFNKSFSKSFSL